jgi:hypothetical protein
MAFVDHEFALLSIGGRPAARADERLAEALAADRSHRPAERGRKRLPVLPPKTPRVNRAAALKAPLRRRQFRPGR